MQHGKRLRIRGKERMGNDTEMNSREIMKLSHAYWSERAEEFSGLRMEDYGSPMKAVFLGFLQEQLDETGFRRGIEGKSGYKVLDVGCGAGFFSLLMAELGCRVTGVDFSREMLEQAAQNAGSEGFKEIQFLQMDVQDLNFPDETFDFIITRNVMWVLPDADRAYDGMIRVLKSGGRLINMDANYGRAFNEADERGETPSHPTQTEEQLRRRNRIARDLDVTRAERPQWDMAYLWNKGIRKIQCIRDLEAYLRIREWNKNDTKTSAGSRADMFAVIADK